MQSVLYKLALLLLLCSVGFSQISFGGLTINSGVQDSIVYEQLSYNDIALSKTEQLVRIGKGEFTQFTLSVYSKKNSEVFLSHDHVHGVEIDYPSDGIEVLDGAPSRVLVYVRNSDVYGEAVVVFTVHSTPFKDNASYLGEFYLTIQNPYSEKIEQSTRLSTNNSYFGETYTLGHNIRYNDINVNFGVNHLVRDKSLSLYNNYDTQTSFSVGVSYNWPTIRLNQTIEETVMQQYYLLSNKITK
ncbi:MAG: hypothetical protein H8D23_17735 [Candidatus Brocadiales bacterium]|nr:hypothetical protein [Candidatus Brocadiales bacterium]